MNDERLDMFFGDFLRTLSRSILGSKKSKPRTNIACSAGGITISDGQMEFNPGMVIRTDEIDLIVSGQVDLGREAPSLVLLTKSRKGLGISPVKVVAPRLNVTGNLTKPVVSVDRKATAVSAGVAVLTGGVSALTQGMFDRITSSGKACDLLYDRALENGPMTH